MSVKHAFTDIELATLLNQGSSVAFQILYERYWKKLFVIAAKRLENEDEAEEIVQDIFLNLWRRREAFTLTTGFDNYFSVAVKFEIMDVMRKRVHITAFQKNIQNAYSEADLSTIRELDVQDIQRRLQLTINKLPEKCQLVFKLRQEGLSQKEIAASLNISEKTVEAHLSKARKTLRTAFGSIFMLVALFYLK